MEQARPGDRRALAGDDTGAEWGPAMMALPSDRHRAFVLAYIRVHARLWVTRASYEARRLRNVEELGKIVECHRGPARPR